jgi:hypothetical protein
MQTAPGYEFIFQNSYVTPELLVFMQTFYNVTVFLLLNYKIDTLLFFFNISYGMFFYTS